MHGRYAGGVLGYDVFTEAEKSDACETLPLDPITCAGNCKIPALRVFVDRFTFTHIAVDLICRPEVFHRIVQPPPSKDPFSTTVTADKWKEHLDSLEKTTPQPILAEVYAGEVFGVCTYFAVPKDETSARAIFNGRTFSLACESPPPTNLQDITELLEALSNIHGSDITMVEGDIRHFFHQLKLNEKISQFFCIRRGHGKNDFRRWTTLPMGWSHSPFIAQGISMGLVLSTLARCGIDVSEYEQLNTPPPMVKVYNDAGQLVLVAAVWYDNILLFTSLSNIALAFYQTFKTTCEEINLELKRWVLHSPKSFRLPDTRKESTETVSEFIAPKSGLPPRPSYLNLEFKRMNKRQLDDSLQPHLSWRLAPKQIDKVSNLLARYLRHHEQPLTFRDVAKGVGTILWHKHISFVPLCRISSVIEVSRWVGKFAPECGWNSIADVPETDIKLLISYLTAVIANEWMSMPGTSRLTLREVTVATDSSDNMWGALVWSSARFLVPELNVFARRWRLQSNVLCAKHIYS